MRVLSGIQPSGILHLGNYFGMMRPSLELARKAEAYYFIADYHALTSHPSPEDLRRFVHGVAVDFLACGLDPATTVFFRQSDVPEHVELAWLLSAVTPMGLLERCHSFKDKTARGIPANHALFSYPVLMASDILIYDSDAVPVGKDQKQHLEVTRDIAIKFNERFGPIFKLPDPIIGEDVAVIPGTDGQKMSKSYDNTIPLFMEESALKKKVMSLVTDSRLPAEPKDPEPLLPYQLYKLVATPAQAEEMASKFRAGGYGYGDAKKALLGALLDYFGPLRKRREEILKDPGYVEDVLRKGAEKARTVARETLMRARKAVGLNQ